MRVLITGGTGYLGARLAEYFSSGSDHTPIIGTRDLSAHKTLLPSVAKITMDWESETSLLDATKDIDAVIHTAGMNAAACTADPVAALAFNGVATGRLLHAAIRNGVKRFIYFSTAHVYCSPLEGEIDENTCPVSLHPYATSHRAGEDIVRAAHAKGEIEGIVVRLSNAFGAPVDKAADCWTLLVNDLCRQAVITGSMKLQTSGLQRRDFITIRDVCRAIAHLLGTPVTLTGNIYNVGGNWSPTVWELAKLIQKECVNVLGFEPPLTRPEPIPSDAGHRLLYVIRHLLNSGFSLSSDQQGEIRQLLLFCKS